MRSFLRTPNPLVCGILAGILTLTAYLSYYHLKFGLNHPPSATGDEPEYDSLGWELAHGRGFRVDYTRAKFRQPYEEAAKESTLYRLTSTTRAGVIANRPPGLPFVMSLTNRLFGRQYWGIRAINALCMSVICGFLAGMVCRSAGLPSAIITAIVFVLVDTRTRLYGRAILTEAMAALAVAVLCGLLFRFSARPTRKQAAILGVVFAGALLTRSQFILWLPGLALLLFWLAMRRSPSANAAAASEPPNDGIGRFKTAAACSATLVIVSLMIVSPWMLRNCVVLREFMPLGSQGGSQLSAAFGDSAWEHNGTWTNLRQAGFFESVLRPEMSVLEAEVAMAHYSQRKAFEWIAANPGKAVLLAPLKIAQEFRPRTIPEGTVLFLSIIGAIVSWRHLRTRILLAILVINSMAIAATWSVEGRFLVPILFAQHALIGLGLESALDKWRANRERSAHES